MIYAFMWFVLIGFTLLFSLGAFFWALHNGQFEDQERLNYLPLIDLPAGDPPHRPGRQTVELYVLGICVLLVSAALVVSLLLGAQLFGGGGR